MRKLLLSIGLLIILCVLAWAIYQIPFVNERLAWRVEEYKADIKYLINPPEESYFIPQGQADMTIIPSQTPLPIPTRRPTPTLSLTQIPTTAPPLPTPTITPTPTPIPEQVLLTGITHAYQMWNNCGPANLAMALSFWGWKGDQRQTAAFMKPNPRDRNVMPYEMVSFVEEETDLKIVSRVGGDLQMLKTFVAAGFPVIVEKGFESPKKFDGWMGHYEVVNGYDDQRQKFLVQDSYNGPNQPVDYDLMLNQWRAFNYAYLVIYPPTREAEVFSILGNQVDINQNYQYAADKALADTQALKGRDKYFAWYNRGTNLENLKDFAGAATAYDAAFAQEPAIPKEERPWRMLWYQTGPYFAYFYTQRYQDVINLATMTLDAMSEPNLEESYYWRARAKAALGNNQGALADVVKSLEYHPEFQPSLELKNQLTGTQ